MVSRTAEAGAATGSKPSLSHISLEAKKLTALVYLTEELIEDSAPAAMVLLDQLVPRAFQFAIEREIVEGAGATE